MIPVQRLNHAVLYVADLASAVAFYTDALGFEVHQEIPGRAAFLGALGVVLTFVEIEDRASGSFQVRPVARADCKNQLRVADSPSGGEMHQLRAAIDLLCSTDAIDERAVA